MTGHRALYAGPSSGKSLVINALIIFQRALRTWKHRHHLHITDTIGYKPDASQIVICSEFAWIVWMRRPTLGTSAAVVSSPVIFFIQFTTAVLPMFSNPRTITVAFKLRPSAAPIAQYSSRRPVYALSQITLYAA